MRTFMNMLTPKDVQKIQSGAMEILESVGIDFYSQKALDFMAAQGFKVDGSRVYFNEKKLLELIALAPRSFVLKARDPEKDITIGAGVPVSSAGDGYVNIVSREGKRGALFSDTINYIKLLSSSDMVDLPGGNLITATDVTGNIAYVHTMMLSYLMSDKPMKGLGYNATCAKMSIDMARIAFGDAAAKDDPIVLGAYNPTSPLMWSEDSLEGLAAYVEAGQPVEFAPLGMAGTTTPITMAGNLVMCTAEVLSGVAFCQALRPGIGILPGIANSITDMKSMIMAMGAPECSMMASAMTQVLHAYDLPIRCGGMYTDALDCDVQAAAESLINVFVPVVSGADFLMHLAGMAEGFASFSYEKFIVDEDLLSMSRYFNRGINVDDLEMGVDTIREVGPGGNFLATGMTLERCRDAWTPKTFVRNSFEQWKDAGAQAVYDKAGELWKERLGSFEKPYMEKSAENKLWAYAQDAYGQIDGVDKGMV